MDWNLPPDFSWSLNRSRVKWPGYLALFLILLSGALSAQSPLSAPLGDEEIEARRKKLESWTHEPVAMQGHDLYIRMDRKDSSFEFADQRVPERLYSSWHHRGFARVQLSNGKSLPIDKVKGLHVTGDKISFLAGSTEGELPELRLEIRNSREDRAIAIRYEIPEESRADIESVTLLDRALWTTDSDGGGMAMPRGLGEWISPDGKGPEKIELSQGTRIAPGKNSYAAPLVAIRKRGTGILVFWDREDISVTATRENVTDPAFPGNAGVFLSLSSRNDSAEVFIAGGLLDQTGVLDAARVYRENKQALFRLSSLRFKTSSSPETRKFIGSVFFRPSMSTPAVFPHSRGKVKFRFEEIAAIAGRMKNRLEIGQAVFLLDHWLGSARDSGAPKLSALEACGGDEGLRNCAEKLKANDYLLGLTLDREQLIPDAAGERPSGELAWKRALEFSRSPGAWRHLKENVDLQMLLLREREGFEKGAALAARRQWFEEAREMFPLLGTNIANLQDISNVTMIEGLITREDKLPEHEASFPLFGALLGQQARFLSRPGDGLEPNDASYVLTHLLLGQPPTFELPDHLYYEIDAGSAQDGTVGDGTVGDGAVGDGPEWCFARAGGWTADRDLTPRDVFIKNIYELCGHLAEHQAREPLASHRLLTPDGLVRESLFGFDMRIVVNFGTEPYIDEPSNAVLPQYGFVIRYPFFFAFHAIEMNGMKYEKPVFFTVRSLEGKLYLRAEKTRIYHGFGQNVLRLGGKTFTIDREAVVRIW